MKPDEEFDPIEKPCRLCAHSIQDSRGVVWICNFHYEVVGCFDGDLIRRPRVSADGNCDKWEARA